jgi:hypothetical protein
MRALILVTLFLAACGSAPVPLTVTAPAAVELNELHRGRVLLPAEHLCAQPKLTLNGVPLSSPGTADPHGLLLPNEAVWEVLHEMLQDLHALCDVERAIKLDVDCSGQSPTTEGETYTSSTASLDVIFRKSTVRRAYASPALENVSPLSAITAVFGPYGVEESTLVNALTVRDVPGELELLELDDRTELVFLPKEPLQPGQTYSVRLNLGLTGLRTATGGCIRPDGADSFSWSFTTREAASEPFQATVGRSGPGLRLRWDALGAANYRVFAVSSSSDMTGGTLLDQTREASIFLERSAGTCFRVDAEPHGRAVVSSTVACVR